MVERGASPNVPAARFWLALAGIALGGAAVRALRLGAQIVIDDEWHALNVVHDFGYRFIFGHFGTADHSIPLALYYEWLANTIGLGEWGMRAPALIAGVATIVAVPALLRRWLTQSEALLAAALIAASPLLINFSRTARPYALLALLIGACLPLAWRWWRDGGLARASGWIGAAVLAAWINPLTVVITGAPLLAFGAEALAAGRGGRWRGLRRMLGASAAFAAPTVALLALPLANDAVSLATKAATHAAGPGTAAVALSLFAGSGSAVVTGLVMLAAAAGWFELKRRDPGFARFLLLVAAIGTLGVLMTGAAWIKHGLVLARYLIGLLPAFLALVALGLVWGVTRARRQRVLARVRPAWLYVAALALLVGLGPVPGWYARYSQFTGHLSHQFDYDRDRNVIARLLDAVPVPAFYRAIAAAHPHGDAVVVEAPWHLESFWNPLDRFQRVHGQRIRIGFVNGVCAEPFYGELDAATPGLRFRNFVFLADLLAARVTADYLVLHRRSVPGARALPVAIERCIEAARERFGTPWIESGDAVLLRLNRGQSRHEEESS